MIASLYLSPSGPAAGSGHSPPAATQKDKGGREHGDLQQREGEEQPLPPVALLPGGHQFTGLAVVSPLLPRSPDLGLARLWW